MGDERARYLPAVLATVTFVVAAVAAFALVRGDLDPVDAGDVVFVNTGGWKFLFIIPTVAAAAVYGLARRLRDGVELSRDDLALFFADLGPRSEVYRNVAEPTVRDLGERLAAIGYRLEVIALDPLGQPAGPAAGDRPLAGTQLRFTERRARARRGSVTLRISPARGDRSGFGTLEIADGPDGLYGELARFVAFNVGELMGGSTFGRSGSRLKPQPTAILARELPARPQRLPADA